MAGHLTAHLELKYSDLLCRQVDTEGLEVEVPTLVGLSYGTAAACPAKPFKACALNWKLTCHSASTMHTHRSQDTAKPQMKVILILLKGSVQKSHPAAVLLLLGC